MSRRPVGAEAPKASEVPKAPRAPKGAADGFLSVAPDNRSQDGRANDPRPWRAGVAGGYARSSSGSEGAWAGEAGLAAGARKAIMAFAASRFLT